MGWFCAVDCFPWLGALACFPPRKPTEYTPGSELAAGNQSRATPHLCSQALLVSKQMLWLLHQMGSGMHRSEMACFCKPFWREEEKRKWFIPADETEEKRTSVPNKLLKDSDSMESALSESRARYTLAFPVECFTFNCYFISNEYCTEIIMIPHVSTALDILQSILRYLKGARYQISITPIYRWKWLREVQSFSVTWQVANSGLQTPNPAGSSGMKSQGQRGTTGKPMNKSRLLGKNSSSCPLGKKRL